MDYFTKETDSFLLGIWQLGFTGLYGVIFTFLFETPSLPGSGAQWGAILGLAIICSAFGFIVQPVAQEYTSPEHTSMLFALEPVFSRSDWGISDYGRCRDCCKHPWRVITPSFPGNLFYFPIQECLGIRFNAQKMRLQLISNVALLDYL